MSFDNLKNSVANKASTLSQELTNSIGEVKYDITNTLSSTQNSVSGIFENIQNKFSSNSYIQGSKAFLESNSLIAKFAFLLLVIIIFVVSIRVFAGLIFWIFTPSNNPILIDGMIDAKQMTIIHQDPSKSGSIPILRSVNDVDGLEFTWSVWMFVEDFSYRQNMYKHVFHKGNDDFDHTGINKPNNCPGLYINKNTNDLVVFMSTFNNINEEIIIKDLPLNKWVHVVIRVIQNQVDVFINGMLTKRKILNSIPKQNYGNVFASMNGGFSGYTSSLRYFDSGIGVGQIQSIYEAGPNMKMISKDMVDGGNNYLSTRWYFNTN